MWRTEKTAQGQDLIWEEVELGIASSPTKGTANIQNANISTESGEVLASFGRTNQSQLLIPTSSPGSITASVSDGSTLLSLNGATALKLKAGSWINVSASSVSSIPSATNPSSVTVNYLVVAGGGGGGAGFSGTTGGGGGGGAGAMRTGTLSVSATSYPITIGSGGAGGLVSLGSNGSNSVFSSITSLGGGAGANGTSPVANANNGGSGGGGSGEQSTGGVGTAGTGTTGGHNGGTGQASATASGGGGGGANAVGGNGSTTVGGVGGAGTASSITGVSVTYAGGGGGGSCGTRGLGGVGGGGNGGDTAIGGDGTSNTGGGGGGASDNSSALNQGGTGGSGIIVISYTTGSMYATGGSITQSGGNTIHTFIASDNFTVVSINTGGLYYVSYRDTNGKIKLSASYDPTGAHAITHGTSGNITFSTVAIVDSSIAKATEKYNTGTTTEYRYYILDANGYVWVYDTAIYDSSLLASGIATTWMLPDPTNYSTIKFAGMAVLNGWLLVVSNSHIEGKPTVDLGNNFRELPDSDLMNPFPTHTNFAYVGHQGKMYYCDGNYIGELFPTTSFVTGIANIQSYASYTATSTIGTITALLGGSTPFSPDGTRIPVVFFTDVYGTLPTAITQSTVYFVDFNTTLGTFSVYNNLVTGSAIDIATGASGNQYFNTFYPLGSDASINGNNSLVQFSPQRVNFPFDETTQCIVEVGNIVLIGCIGSTVYPWNQVDATPSNFIELPENNVKSMVNVNNMAYVFAGNKGNVYITNNSVASLTLKVPDYCAGIAGTPLTYIEPYFTWGDSTYLRGRVYFSILDQTATKAGNCGGVWSFVPSQNVDPSQDVGISLRQENQSSYGTYSGVSAVLISNEEQQNMISPQYWSAWQDSYSTGTSSFGIDQTATTPVTTYVVETDILKSGTLLDQQTYSTVEYNMTTPLLSGDSVQLYFRLNSTDAWTTCGTVIEEANNRLSGYFKQAFQKSQVLQFRAIVTTGGTTASSFGRLKQIRLRK